MYHGGAAVYNSDWEFSAVYVYNNGWKRAIPYVYDNGWKIAGGAGVNMVFLLDKDNKFILDKNSANILVREK